jgi:hypothetical protein
MEGPAGLQEIWRPWHRRGRKWRRVLWSRWRRITERICWHTHKSIYFPGRWPGSTKGKWLDGLSEACWCYCCGDSLKFALHIGNIYWGLRFIPDRWGPGR